MNKKQMTVSRQNFKREDTIDEYPDLSFLEHEYDERAHKIIKSVAYSNEDVKNLGWAEVKKYLKQDADRLRRYGNDWYMLGIRASVVLEIPYGNDKTYILQKITSPGLWGIESNSDESYKDETYQGECNILADMLETMGIKVTD